MTVRPEAPIPAMASSLKVRLAAAVALVIVAFALTVGPLEASVAEQQTYESASYMYDAGADHARANAFEVAHFDATPGHALAWVAASPGHV
ncbi:MAG: hypothetical protein GY743_10725, partial [Planctomycetaceae bacterium]|nr:hypothetical protein [Planctomycetaceae bacterium]